MLGYLNYLNPPTQIALGIAVIFFVMQFIGEILTFKGKVVPEILSFRKFLKRKKEEREIIKELPNTFREMQKTIAEFNHHYDVDNITKRDAWMKNVNCKLEQNDDWVKEVSKKLDENTETTLAILIENKRNAIINFASYVIDENKPVTREQFNRIFKIHKEYEDIIKEKQMTNGEVDVAIHIIEESYENHMKNHTFIEDVRGYSFK